MWPSMKTWRNTWASLCTRSIHSHISVTHSLGQVGLQRSTYNNGSPHLFSENKEQNSSGLFQWNKGFIRNWRSIFPLGSISAIFQPEWFPVRQIVYANPFLSHGLLTGQDFQRLSCLLGNWFSRLWDLINRSHPICLPPPYKRMGCINLWLYLTPYINCCRSLPSLR